MAAQTRQPPPATTGRVRSGRAPALADQPPALALGGTTPDTLLLTALQRVLQAGHPHRALAADRLGVQRVVFVVGIEDARLQPPAGSQLSPFEVVGIHDGSPLVVSTGANPGRAANLRSPRLLGQ